IRPLAQAASGIMVALEGQLPTLYPEYVKAMRQMGFTEDDLEFFHVHIEGDEEHADVGLRLAYEYADTAEAQKLAIAAVRSSASLRYSMLDGIYASVVANAAACYGIVQGAWPRRSGDRCIRRARPGPSSRAGGGRRASRRLPFRRCPG